MALPCALIGIAQLELLVRKLEVKVEDFPFLRDVCRNLHGIDGLAEVAVGKKTAHLALIPQCEPQRNRVRAVRRLLNGQVGGLDGKHTALFQHVFRLLPLAVQFRTDGGNRIERLPDIVVLLSGFHGYQFRLEGLRLLEARTAAFSSSTVNGTGFLRLHSSHLSSSS